MADQPPIKTYASFLDLPTELRLPIYRLHFANTRVCLAGTNGRVCLIVSQEGKELYGLHDILYTCRTVNKEASLELVKSATWAIASAASLPLLSKARSQYTIPLSRIRHLEVSGGWVYRPGPTCLPVEMFSALKYLEVKSLLAIHVAPEPVADIHNPIKILLLARDLLIVDKVLQGAKTRNCVIILSRYIGWEFDGELEDAITRKGAWEKVGYMECSFDYMKLYGTGYHRLQVHKVFLDRPGVENLRH